MQTLGEFYDLKSNTLEKEENIIGNIQGNTTEERTFKIVKWIFYQTLKELRIKMINLEARLNLIKIMLWERKDKETINLDKKLIH